MKMVPEAFPPDGMGCTLLPPGQGLSGERRTGRPQMPWATSPILSVAAPATAPGCATSTNPSVSIRPPALRHGPRAKESAHASDRYRRGDGLAQPQLAVQVGARREGLVVADGQRKLGSPSPGPQLLERRHVGDALQPRAERGLTTEPRQCPVGPQEGLLKGVARELSVLGDEEDRRSQSRFEVLNNQRECLVVPGGPPRRRRRLAVPAAADRCSPRPRRVTLAPLSPRPVADAGVSLRRYCRRAPSPAGSLCHSPCIAS